MLVGGRQFCNCFYAYSIHCGVLTISLADFKITQAIHFLFFDWKMEVRFLSLKILIFHFSQKNSKSNWNSNIRYIFQPQKECLWTHQWGTETVSCEFVKKKSSEDTFGLIYTWAADYITHASYDWRSVVGCTY